MANETPKGTPDTSRAAAEAGKGTPGSSTQSAQGSQSTPQGSQSTQGSQSRQGSQGAAGSQGAQSAGQPSGAQSLSGKKVAILATDGFEQVELLEPRKALDAAGCQTMVVSPKSGSIKGWNFTNWGQDVKVDKTLEQCKPEDFDCLMMPGGVMNPDTLRMNDKAVQFAASFFDAGKPVASICHGPWMVIECGAAYGRQIAAWPSLKTDLSNAGAEWIDQEVCVDGNLVTSRKPDDIPAFNREMTRLFSMSPQQIQEASAAGEEAEAPEEAVALFVRLEAKPGRESDVADFLRSGLSLVEAEPETDSWFGIQLGPSTFCIFDTFQDDAGRQAHLSGRVAQALQNQASDLLAEPPTIERADVLASKRPSQAQA